LCAFVIGNGRDAHSEFMGASFENVTRRIRKWQYEVFQDGLCQVVVWELEYIRTITGWTKCLQQFAGIDATHVLVFDDDVRIDFIECFDDGFHVFAVFIIDPNANLAFLYERITEIDEFAFIDGF